MLVPISKLKPNPFRKLESYPIDRTKVEALIESYEDTSYWGNIVARKVGNDYEIAYGHHRLIALQETLSSRAKVDIIPRELSDADMIKIMARENMEEWGSNAAIETETLRAAIDAYADGQITEKEMGTVPKNTPKNQILAAPSTLELGHKNENGVPVYTKLMLACFLGWTNSKGQKVRPNFAFETAFRGLQLIEENLIKEKHLKGKKRDEAATILEETSRAHMQGEKQARSLERLAKEAKTDSAKQKLKEKATQQRKKADDDAKRVAAHLSKGFSTGHIARDKAKQEARKLVSTPEPTPTVPQLDQMAQRVCAQLDNILNGDDNLSTKFVALCKFADLLEPEMKKDVIVSLNRLSERCSKYQKRLLKKGSKPNVKLITSR